MKENFTHYTKNILRLYYENYFLPILKETDADMYGSSKMALLLT